MYEYMKIVKSNVRVAIENAKHGGKKGKGGKGGKGAKEEEKVLENCAIFYAIEYPEWQKAVLEILSSFSFDENNKIKGEYIKVIKEKMTGPGAEKNIKFAAFIVKEAESVGKEAALELKTPFVEKEVLENN
jgi:hypothetical protein